MSDNICIPPWINGQPAKDLPVSDRGLAYGDGLFETIRITPQGPVLLDYHLDRLQQGAVRLSIDLQPVRMLQELNTFPGMQLPGVVKYMITRGSGGRGYGVEGVGDPCRILQWFPPPEYPASSYELGISVFPCKTRLGLNPVLAGIKHLNRLEQVLARAEWEGVSEFQEGLVCDTNGYPVEGVSSNLFVVSNGEIVTPLLQQCGVKGVMRRWLLEHFQDQGRTVKEMPVTLDQFRVADERFFCNSVFGVWPVARFEHLHWTPGPVSRMAQQLIQSHWF